MDHLFDRLGDLLRSLLGSDRPASYGYDGRDPDILAALEELDAYLEGRWSTAAGHGGSAGTESEAGGQGRGNPRGSAPKPAPPSTLRRDYANLEVPFAAPLEQVQKSYRSLLRRYHPDRFARDPEKQQLATEITKRLNESFQNIQRYLRGSAGSQKQPGSR